MISENLQKAIDGLRIVDVYVQKVLAESYEGLDPKRSSFDNLVLQTKHFVKNYEEIEEVDTENRFLRVYLEMGARWADESVPKDEGVRAVIEASFVAEYSIVTELEKESLDEFASVNASYHVWPYWRELLASQCDRMRLPRVMLPTVQFLK